MACLRCTIMKQIDLEVMEPIVSQVVNGSDDDDDDDVEDDGCGGGKYYS